MSRVFLARLDRASPNTLGTEMAKQNRKTLSKSLIKLQRHATLIITSNFEPNFTKYSIARP